MYRRQWLMAFVASAGAIALGSASHARGFNWGKIEPKYKSILIASASAMVDVCELLLQEFRTIEPKVMSVVERGDSIEGLLAVKRGAIDMAAVTQDINYDEDRENLKNYLIARSYISIIVNPQSPITQLTQAQVSAIFRGEIQNWKFVGGPDAPIVVVSRQRGSSTRQYVEDVVLNGQDFIVQADEVESTKLMAKTVEKNPFAIGYIAAKDDAGDARIKNLQIDDVLPTEITVLSARYPYTHSFYFLIMNQDDSLKKNFIDFVLSKKGQSIVAQAGLIPVA